MSALLRLSGWSALSAGLVHLVQFVVLGIGAAVVEPAFPTPAEVAANYWFGLAGLGTFSLIGMSYLVFFSAATALVWRDASGVSVVWRRGAQTAATIGIGCWFVAGATQLAVRGFNGSALTAASGGDDDIARAALQSAYVGMSAVTIAGAVVLCAWWIAFAVTGRRTRTLGWPTAIAIVVLGALVPLAGWVANLGGIPSVVLAFLVLGPVLLVKARRMRRADAAVPAAVAQ